MNQSPKVEKITLKLMITKGQNLKNRGSQILRLYCDRRYYSPVTHAQKALQPEHEVQQCYQHTS